MRRNARDMAQLNEHGDVHVMNKRKTMGQKLSQFHHLQIDVVETWQTRPFELTVYFAQKAAAEFAFMSMNFLSI